MPCSSSASALVVVIAAVMTASLDATGRAEGCTWFTEPGPFGTAPFNATWDLDVRSMVDAFAVGQVAGVGPVLLDWDGAVWSGIMSPSTDGLPGPFPASGSNLQWRGVAALANGEVWAMGSGSSPWPSIVVGWPIVGRWTGSEWADMQQIDLGLQPEHPFTPIGGVLQGGASSPDGDAWAFGTANAGNGGPGIANVLTVHYDAGDWNVVPFPIGFTRVNVPGDILAFGSDDAWLVGYGDSTSPFYPIIAHWDGSEWSSVETPIAGLAQHMPAAIAATGPEDIWIGGELPSGALFMHFDGNTWTLFPSPIATSARIRAMAALAPDDVWAWSNTGGAFHFDGVTWSAATIPAPDGAITHSYTQMAPIPGANAMWAAGAYSTAAGANALLQRLECGVFGDLDGDGVVGGGDLGILLANWSGAGAGDLDGSGTVDGSDLGALLAAWNTVK